MKRASLYLRLAMLSLPVFFATTYADELIEASIAETDTVENIDESLLLRYPLSPFDTVSIQIFNHSDLSANRRISDAGTVALSLVGEVKIAGLTTSEAQDAIAEAYIEQEYLVKPIVTVQIESFTPQNVTILGEIGGGGRQVPLPIGVRKMEIQRFIALAGGFNDIARQKAVRVERRLKGEPEPVLYTVDVEKIIQTKDTSEVDPFYIEAGDIIFVPRRAF